MAHCMFGLTALFFNATFRYPDVVFSLEKWLTNQLPSVKWAETQKVKACLPTSISSGDVLVFLKIIYIYII